MSLAQTVALRAARMIDPVTSRLIPRPVVLVTAGRIEAVGTDLQIPAGARVIDLSDATLLPGYMDAHTHLCTTLRPDRDRTSVLSMATSEPSAGRSVEGVINARAMLNAGFTTVRDVGNEGDFACAPVKKAIADGRLTGPTMITAGRIIAPYGGQFQLQPDRRELGQQYTCLTTLSSVESFDGDGDRLGDFAPFFVNGSRAWFMTLGSYGAFFDESERLAANDPLCVAGFTLKDTAYRQFSREWGRFLKTALHGRGLSAMHTTDLVQGQEEFEGVSIPDRIECLTRAADIICRHALLVTGAMVDQKEFESEAGPEWPARLGGSYTTMCQRAAQTTATWLQQKRRYQPVIYTFEAGHVWQSQTDKVFESIGRTDFLRKLYQYGHHTFVPKSRCYGAQAADIAAWLSVRIHIGGSPRSVRAFIPPLADMVRHFNLREDSMIRVLTGDVLKDFIKQQRERPVEQDIVTDVGPAKRRFR
jgi:hypothetical protein